AAKASPGSAGPARGRAMSPSSAQDRKSTRLNSSHLTISYAVFCLKKKKRRRAFLVRKIARSKIPCQEQVFNGDRAGRKIFPRSGWTLRRRARVWFEENHLGRLRMARRAL